MDKHILRLMLKILLPASGWLLLCFFGPRCLKFFMPFVIGWIIAMIANPLSAIWDNGARSTKPDS